MDALAEDRIVLVWPSNRRGVTGEVDKCELTRRLDCSQTQPAHEVSCSGPSSNGTERRLIEQRRSRTPTHETIGKRPFAIQRGMSVGV